MQDQAQLQEHPQPGKGRAAGGWSGVFVESLSGNSKRPAPPGARRSSTRGKRPQVTCCIFFSLDKCVLNASGTWVPWECRTGEGQPWLASLLHRGQASRESFGCAGDLLPGCGGEVAMSQGAKAGALRAGGLCAGSSLGGCSSTQIRGGRWQLGASRARSWGNLASRALGGRWRV